MQSRQIPGKPRLMRIRSITGLFLVALTLVGSCDDLDRARLLLQHSSFWGEYFAVTQNRPRKTKLRPSGSSVFLGAFDGGMLLEVRSNNSLSGVSIADERRAFVVEWTVQPKVQFRLIEIRYKKAIPTCRLLTSSPEAITNPMAFQDASGERILHFSGNYDAGAQGTPIFDMRLTESIDGKSMPLDGPDLGLPQRLSRLPGGSLVVLAYSPSNEDAQKSPQSVVNEIVAGPTLRAVRIMGKSYAVQPMGPLTDIDDKLIGLAASQWAHMVVVEHYDPEPKDGKLRTELSYIDSLSLELKGNMLLPDGFAVSDPFLVVKADGEALVRLAGRPKEDRLDEERVSLIETGISRDPVVRTVDLKAPKVLETADCEGL